MSASIGPAWVTSVQQQPWYNELVSAAQNTNEPLDVLLATIATEDPSLTIEPPYQDNGGYSVGLFGLHSPGVADAVGGVNALATGNTAADANEQIYLATQTISRIIQPGATSQADLQAMTVDWPGGYSTQDLPTRFANLSAVDAQMASTTSAGGSTLSGGGATATLATKQAGLPWYDLFHNPFSIYQMITNPGGYAKQAAVTRQKFWQGVEVIGLALLFMILGYALIRSGKSSTTNVQVPPLKSIAKGAAADAAEGAVLA